MYRRWTTMFAFLAFTLAPAALVYANQEVRGTVTAIDETTLTLETDKGQMVGFEIAESSVMPEALAVGDQVAVHHLAGTGDDTHLQPITKVLIAEELGTGQLGAEESGALPQTASPVAGLALVGMVALGGAAACRRRRG